MMPGAIMWCEQCNNAPASGVLKVIRTGETQPTDMFSCQDCVDELQPSDWLGDNMYTQ